MATTTKRDALISTLNDAMDAMQDDPELEGVDTLSLMEDAISEALEYFTGVRRTTRGKQEENAKQEEDYLNDPRQ